MMAAKLAACAAILVMGAASGLIVAHAAANIDTNTADLVPIAERRPAELTWDHVRSDDGGVLAWVETDEDGERHGYQKRIPASDPNADENVNEWDRRNAEEWKPNE